MILLTGGIPHPPRSRHPPPGADTPLGPHPLDPPEETPPGSRHPQVGADTHTPDPPRGDTPQEQTPPWDHTPRGADTPQTTHPPGTTPQEQTPPRADTPLGAKAHPRSRHPPGSRSTPPGPHTPPREHAMRYGQHAGGTHPTGMQSCLLVCPSECVNVFTLPHNLVLSA